MIIDNIITFLIDNPIVKDLLFIVGLILIAGILHFIARKYILRLIRFLFSRTKIPWNEELFEWGVFDGLPQLVPALVLAQGLTILRPEGSLGQRLVAIWVIIILVKFVNLLLTGILRIYNTYEISHRKPINSYIQIIKIVLALAAAIFVISLLLGQSPWILLSGLGAITAVLMLVFQDTILGFVASIQINSTDLFRVGDWLSVPEFDADGPVIEITLHSIRVQNFDKTITTIPAHKLVTNSFRNYRGMFESGGRRIKRSILIDQTSVQFCTDEMVAKFKKIHYLKDYIEEKETELAQYNSERNIDDSVTVNGRRMTNLGTLRAYLTSYLRSHPGIHQELTFLIRQLDPTRAGIPMEIYVFTSDPTWAVYEGIQSDIFDHILATLPEFGLRVAQDPTGYDMQSIKMNNTDRPFRDSLSNNQEQLGSQQG